MIVKLTTVGMIALLVGCVIGGSAVRLALSSDVTCPTEQANAALRHFAAPPDIQTTGHKGYSYP